MDQSQGRRCGRQRDCRLRRRSSLERRGRRADSHGLLSGDHWFGVCWAYGGSWISIPKNRSTPTMVQPARCNRSHRNDPAGAHPTQLVLAGAGPYANRCPRYCPHEAARNLRSDVVGNFPKLLQAKRRVVDHGHHCFCTSSARWDAPMPDWRIEPARRCCSWRGPSSDIQRVQRLLKR